MEIESIVILLLAYALIFLGMTSVIQNIGSTNDSQFGKKNTEHLISGLVFTVGGLVIAVTVLVLHAFIK